MVWQPILAAVAGVLFWHLPILSNLLPLIRSDTLLTLSAGDSVMLILLTTLMSGFLIVCITLKSYALQGYSRASGVFDKVLVAMLDLLSTVTVLWSVVALAPQAFYQFYRIVFNGLPSQWVIKPVSFSDFCRLWFASNADSLAELATSLVLWIALMSGFLAWVTFARADWHKV